MAMKCPVCSSADTAAGIDNYMCHNCGALFDGNGEKVDKGLGQSTRDELLRRLEPKQDNVVGNLADLHRLGAMNAADPSEPAFALPPGVDGEDVAPLDAEAFPTDDAAEAAGVPTGDAEVAEAPAKKSAAKK